MKQQKNYQCDYKVSLALLLKVGSSTILYNGIMLGVAASNESTATKYINHLPVTGNPAVLSIACFIVAVRTVPKLNHYA